MISAKVKQISLHDTSKPSQTPVKEPEPSGTAADVPDTKKDSVAIKEVKHTLPDVEKDMFQAIYKKGMEVRKQAELIKDVQSL
jgi:hypothetical protein